MVFVDDYVRAAEKVVVLKQGNEQARVREFFY